MRKFYVYVFLREDRYTPYYVGKGSKNRCIRKSNRVGSKPPKDKSRIVKVKENLTEEEAFHLEKLLILFWGRKDLGTGVLYNKTDGGEGTSGLRHSEESKKKMRTPKSKEHRENLSIAIREKWNLGEYDREDYRIRQLGKTRDEESKSKTSKSLLNYWSHNVKVVEQETKQRIRDTIRRKLSSGEIEPRKYPSSKGTKWWNNGNINKRTVECPGPEWNLGRLSK